MAWSEVAVRTRTLAVAQTIRLPGVPGHPFRIAYGHSFSRPPTRLALRRRSGEVDQIVGLDRATGRIAQLWPPFRAELERDGERLLVKVAVTRQSIAAARRLLDQLHGEGAAQHGMFVCLYSIADGCRELVGVAQIGEYFHTHFPGRSAFGRAMLGPRYSSLGRGDVVSRIPIAAAKRFAIVEDRQGQALGDVLARQTLKVARNYRWPPARVVEVSRYMSARRYFAICCGRARDFLSRSGYVPVPPIRWMRQGSLNERISAALTDRDVPGYYYADISDLRRPRSFGRLLEGDD